MLTAHIPNNSVVLSTEEYNRLLTASQTLENIEAQKRNEEHQARLAAESHPVEAVFETKDGLTAHFLVPAGPPRFLNLPCKTRPRVAYTDFNAAITASQLRSYGLVRFDHGLRKFLYREV